MQDIYQANKRLAGAFKGSTAGITISGTASAQRGAIVQNIQLGYNRQVTRVMELGSDDQYYMIGTSEGQGQFGAIVGPSKTVLQMIRTLGDECTAANRVLHFQAAADGVRSGCQAGELTARASGALLTGVTIGITTQDFMINQGGTFMFVGMEL